VNRLPASVDDLRGLRAARWIRESTTGQFDRYGPEAQSELQARAVKHLGLLESGQEWRVAHSGRTVYRSPAMVAMLEAAAAGAFDVLLVGYVSRWQRNLRQTLNLLEDTLHPAGVAVWFCDEEILSSSERDWDQLVAEATDAERYSRRLSRRIREGYASKLARERDPGGRPPYGFRRDERKLLEVDSSKLVIIRRVYELAVARLTDRQVAAETGLPLYTVRGMLANPLYAGRLPDGTSTHLAPIVPRETWDQVQAVRETRRTRDGHPATHRVYALSMLRCSSCGRRLIGDTGRYRHTDPCAAFVGAFRRPSPRTRGQHRLTAGQSYAASEYEALVREILGRVSLGAETIAEVMTGADSPQVDRLALARLERERSDVLARYRRDRDSARLEAEMARLDELEHQARESGPDVPLPPGEAVHFLRNLPALWEAAPASRRGLAESLFERIEVLGLARMHVEPTAAAIRRGLAEAFSRGTHGYGRGERSEARASHELSVWLPGPQGRRTLVTMGGALPPLRAVRSA
jgi:DNA invertase Pin-like site-specific DNA recombinase